MSDSPLAGIPHSILLGLVPDINAHPSARFVRVDARLLSFLATIQRVSPRVSWEPRVSDSLVLLANGRRPNTQSTV